MGEKKSSDSIPFHVHTHLNSILTTYLTKYDVHVRIQIEGVRTLLNFECKMIKTRFTRTEEKRRTECTPKIDLKSKAVCISNRKKDRQKRLSTRTSKTWDCIHNRNSNHRIQMKMRSIFIRCDNTCGMLD